MKKENINSKTRIVIEKVKSNKSEFLEFLKNYNIFELAMGVVVGSALKDLTTAIVEGLIMPFIGIFTPSGMWRNIVFTVGNSEFKIGNLISAVINFLIIALFAFIVIRKLLKLEKIDKHK